MSLAWIVMFLFLLAFIFHRKSFVYYLFAYRASWTWLNMLLLVDLLYYASWNVSLLYGRDEKMLYLNCSALLLSVLLQLIYYNKARLLINIQELHYLFNYERFAIHTQRMEESGFFVSESSHEHEIKRNQATLKKLKTYAKSLPKLGNPLLKEIFESSVTMALQLYKEHMNSESSGVLKAMKKERESIIRELNPFLQHKQKSEEGEESATLMQQLELILQNHIDGQNNDQAIDEINKRYKKVRKRFAEIQQDTQ